MSNEVLDINSGSRASQLQVYPLIAHTDMHHVDLSLDMQNPGKDPLDHQGTSCPQNNSTWPPQMSSCSTVIPMWYRHQRILLMPVLSWMSVRISLQPSPNAQWQEPRCEDLTLSSDRAARWTAQQQEGTWYQCQQSDLTLWELVYVCVCPRVCVGVGERDCTVPSDCWEHMCWRRPECVLKWRLMNKRLECVCV